MTDYNTLTKLALGAMTEEERESAGELFESMLDDINSGDFQNFEEFANLAIFLAQDYWPEVGMMGEPSSQLFAEYDIGLIEWIWKDPSFLSTLPKFLENDIHFGCFVLTEVRSNEKFTQLFAEIALENECEICEQTGEGWISAASYVAEDNHISPAMLEKYFEHFQKKFQFGEENEKYASLSVLRSLAGNIKTPNNILQELAKIHEPSLRHEIRSIGGDDSPEKAEADSFIDFKAKETLARK